jgi:hypothetical protein
MVGARLLYVPRVVVGYHGTSVDRALDIVATGRFSPSTNDYDWLGHGIYFWEFAPLRAWQWAHRKYGSDASVIEAQIELGYCLDLTDVRYTDSLRTAYDGLREVYARTGTALPVNKGKANCLDCLVINNLCGLLLTECETVRGPFLEGYQVYPGSAFMTQSHVQIVVRNNACIRSSLRRLLKEE